MPSCSTQKSWKWQAIALALSVLELTSAAPVEVAETSNDVLVDESSFSGVASASAAPTDITQARVNQVKASTNNRVSTACCTLLKIVVGSKVSDPGSPVYEASTQSYFSNQARSVDPWCIVSAASTTDVSRTVGTLNLLKNFGLTCPFAIRAGGHTPHTGAATIEYGVTLSLAALNQVTIASNKKTTSIGPGARWLDVYQKTDAQGLTVVGGRVATVGVGGLVTGGGISFFSPRYGFSVDNVQAYEVVMYDGSVVIASASSRPDLFFALKGGNNNFGVVTRFDVKAFVQGSFLGGQIIQPYTAKADNLASFVAFTGQPNYDIYGALINSYVYSAATGWLIANNIQYTKAETNPAVFQNFTSSQPQLVNTMRIANLSDFAIELAGSNAVNSRQLFYTSTWGNDLDLLTKIVDSQQSVVASLSGVQGLTWSMSLQPLVTAITKVEATTGGNALGLKASSGNLVLALISAGWANSADDAVATDAVTKFFASADALAQSKGKLNSYKYLNYAYKTQDPIKGYGAANLAKLRAASKKYDPNGVFQTLVPGGFKLW